MTFVLGMMCGTSADGVSAALIEWPDQGAARPPLNLAAHGTFPFSAQVRASVFRLYPPQRFAAEELLDARIAVSEAIAGAGRALLQQAGLTPESVRLAVFQGPVIFYRHPEAAARAGQAAGVLELADPARVAAQLGVPAVSHLRDNDMAHGGRGAPLSAWFDWWYLRDDRAGRVVENIGGIANMTILYPGAGPEDVVAFDVGPGNMVIDAVVRRLTSGQEHYDRDGVRARRGHVHAGLLDRLLIHPYFRRPPPKTAGREEFGDPYVDEVFREAGGLGVSGDDLVATVTALTAATTERALRQWIAPGGPVHELVLTGGGARNPTLVDEIRRRVAPVALRRVDEFGLPAEAREAVAWAVMGAMSVLAGQPVTLPSVTGARGAVRLGSLTWPA